jgi:hypothetical protein
MLYRFKVAAVLTLIAFIIVLFHWLFKEKPETFPESGTVTYEQLDEIINLAEDRTRHYGLILDDIVDKVNEIKQDMKTEWELQHESTEEKRQDFVNEQLF